MEIPDTDGGRGTAAGAYDYLLGGSDSTPSDRRRAEQVLKVFPESGRAARDNRSWIGRIVRAVTELGCRQFLDVGSGLPTVDNVHQVAHRYDPASRVVYSDVDPITITHGRALLDSDQAWYVHADARDPRTVLSGAAKFLDFARPVAVIMAAVLHYITNVDLAALVRQYVDALAPGSCLAISHPTSDRVSDEAREVIRLASGGGIVLRSAEEIEAAFCGLPLVEPGLVDIQHWRPMPDSAEEPASLRVLGGLALVRPRAPSDSMRLLPWGSLWLGCQVDPRLGEATSADVWGHAGEQCLRLVDDLQALGGR